jgi:cell division initiation protein
MELNPLDLRNQTFRKKTLGGVDAEEVYAFLRLVADQLDEQKHIEQELRDQLHLARQQVDHYRGMEGLLQETAITLQKVLEDKRAEANREADLILAEAKAQAWKETEAIRREAETIRRDIEALKAQRVQFFVRMRHALDSHKELLESLEESTRESV